MKLPETRLMYLFVLCQARTKKLRINEHKRKRNKERLNKITITRYLKLKSAK